jgi:hypothetical protein
MIYIRFNFGYYLKHPNQNEPKEFFLRRNLEESADTFVAAKGWIVLESIILFLTSIIYFSGKRVALFQVHFEGYIIGKYLYISQSHYFFFQFQGNVGDQMETIPLLRKLHEWGGNISSLHNFNCLY